MLTSGVPVEVLGKLDLVRLSVLLDEVDEVSNAGNLVEHGAVPLVV